jgi:hypothetical protein
MSDLSTSTLQSLQALFRDCCFLMIDEKSIVDLKMFSLIDDRLHVIFPATSHRPFGGINVLICGDFCVSTCYQGHRVYLIYSIAGTALNTGLIGALCPQGVYPIHWGKLQACFAHRGSHCRCSEPIEAVLAAVVKLCQRSRKYQLIDLTGQLT